MSIKVLFVCLGNICRSPTAHGIFARYVKQQQFDHLINVDSAGTGDWHIGKAPDERSSAAALRRGYDLSVLRARQVSAVDFEHFDYILAMDKKNLRDLQKMRPSHFNGELALFLDYGNHGELEVPDPYYGDGEGFERVLDLVENASQHLLRQLIERHHLVRGIA
ncbi:MAG: phosphotyrosine protein phosphatase [Verrucomicrobiaceae bacterium]|nr:phosphotyrosine protein phosphatase [Verrucomicrobiaceae bacterium]